MFKNYRRLVIIYLFLFGVQALTPLKAQVYDLTFEHITIDDGLAQNSPNCTFQDKDGFIWFGTQEGLSKYYGFGRFENYKLDLSDTNSLSDIWIYDIAQDKEGYLWIATRFGLNRLNPNTREIKRYFNNPKDITTLNDNEVFGLYVDNQDFIWVKTKDALSKLDKKSNKFIHYEHYKDYFSTTAVIRQQIIEDRYGVIWVATPDGLNFFDKEYEQFTRMKHDAADPSTISSNYITALCEDSKGNLWIGTNNGLNKYNRKTKNFTRYYNIPGVQNSLVNNSIGAILEDFDGNIWIGTSKGLSIYNLQNEKFANYKAQTTNQTGLSNDEIISLYKGSSRIVWIGTNGGGVNKADMKAKKFKLYRKSSDENSMNLSSNIIASIFINRDSMLWVGTYGSGLNVINRNNGEVTKYSATSENNKIVDNYVHAILKDSKGFLWFGTRNGINVFNTTTRKMMSLQEYIPNTTRDLNLIQKRVYSLIEDSKNNIWIATERGLFTANLITHEVHNFRYTVNDTTGLCSDRTTSLIQDRDGYVWIATGNGLNKYDPISKKMTQYKSSVNAKNTISHNSLYSVFEDSEGYIWIGTAGNGVNKYDKLSNTFSYYTEKEGLPNGTIYEIDEDNEGNIWFSTGRGLAKLDKISNLITSYDTDDGLQSLEFNNGAKFKSSKGELFFGGINGINYFFPEQIRYNDNIPKLTFIDIEIMSDDGKRRFYLNDKNQIELSYKDYMFTVFFAALEYTKPEKNSYSYKMENLDDNWIDIGNQSSKTFSNLAPGEYIFKLKGSNNDNVWNEDYISLKIIIKPPLWRTNWAYTLYLLVIVLVLYLFIELRTRKLKEANVVLREKQMAALEIAKQKEELSIKNKSIFDSINYAKRIQEAMMPSEYLFKKLLTDSFIYYKPKDIVSGDFYWIAEKNNKIFVAAADCTGHGVPGAFMSIIGFDLLRNITKEQGIEDPAQILNLLNEGITETFSKNVADKTVKDGMDVALCVIDRDNFILEYSGAINPLYLVRNNQIITVRGNRFSIGMADENSVSEKFESHTVPLKENDVVYIFSDGFADQFGGPFGKKYKFSRFRQLLLTIHSLPMKKQKAFIDENLNNWKGDLEQVDDILVIGIKISKQ